MSYLISQMWLCLLIAALLGFIIGHLLTKLSNQKKLNNLEINWQRKLDEKEKDYTSKLTKIDAPAVSISEKKVITKAEKTSYSVEEIEGIGESYSKKLRDKNITTTQQLLDKCGDIEGRIEVANHIGIEDFVIFKWASMADLMRISGIEGQIAELMVYAGIDSTQDLGQQDASSLHNILSSSNAEQNRVKEIPDEASLEQMIGQARELPALIQDI